ncbi:hypothetical protein FRX31_026578 [Thalictrum thalictroides]|uniref:Uncharacterized protein n=1 Tax=Thalictrum thalictroides TaxID=46969 RepID=A0A7J6VFD1_THATH|nr:hypothetical protein FRX31_026578 [Thalictrum thalictroides]
MQLDPGFWDQYQSQIIQEDEKAVALGNDEDNEATMWDSEVDVFDYPKSWGIDILNDMMYDDSAPMFRDDNRSPNLTFDLNESPKSPIMTFDLNLDVSPREHYSPTPLNSLDQQLNDEMYDDSQPMFGPYSTPDYTRNGTNIPDLNIHPEEMNEHPADMNEQEADFHGYEADVDDTMNQHPADMNGHPADMNAQLDGQTREVKRELFKIFDSLYNRPNVGCASHTKSLHVGYTEPCVGQVYRSRDDLTRDIKTYSIQNMFSFSYVRTCPQRIICRCKVQINKQLLGFKTMDEDV